MKNITIIIDKGKELCLVPLGRDGRKGTASIWRDDLEFLLKLGLSPTWNTVLDSYVTAPARKAPGAHVLVARVLLDAGVGQSIRYLDGDKGNLRSENLMLVSGGGSRRDRDFLRVQGNRNLFRTSVQLIEGSA